MSDSPRAVAINEIALPLSRIATGKVREIFELDQDRLLLVATDRISAYDVVMREGIPLKGVILTQMTDFWLRSLTEVCPNHLISTAVEDLPASLQDHGETLAGRFMIVQRLEMLQVEFIVRGYLVGSGWKDYQQTGAVSGVKLPSGLQLADKLPEAIFTPSTKAAAGHDENISAEQAAGLAGAEHLEIAANFAISLYRQAADLALEKGIILADTKFEFGILEGRVVLGDEVLTPDSSRYWPAEDWRPGVNPPSFDKQYLRDWLDSSGWDRQAPPPQLPNEIIDATSAKYVEAFHKLTGGTLGHFTAR